MLKLGTNNLLPTPATKITLLVAAWLSSQAGNATRHRSTMHTLTHQLNNNSCSWLPAVALRVCAGTPKGCPSHTNDHNPNDSCCIEACPNKGVLLYRSCLEVMHLLSRWCCYWWICLHVLTLAPSVVLHPQLLGDIVFLVHVQSILDCLDCLLGPHDVIHLHLLVLILLVVLKEPFDFGQPVWWEL